MEKINDNFGFNSKISTYIFIIYSSFTLMLFYFSPLRGVSEDVFFWQFLTLFCFLVFFYFGIRFRPEAYIIFALAYQLFLSLILHKMVNTNLYLLSNNNDPFTYIKWASIAQKTSSFNDYFALIKSTTFEFSDWGYPVFLYPMFNFFSSINDALMLACIVKSFIYVLGSFYLYKLSKYFLSNNHSKYVFLFWVLNPSSLFYNAVNLKENVFVTICIYSVYFLIKFYKTKKTGSLFMFIFFTSLTLFFRVFITLFIIFTFIIIILARKITFKYFFIMWFLIFFVAFFVLQYISNLIPGLTWYLRQSLGGEKNISMIVLFIIAFISPIPSLSQNRFPDNYLVCSYSVFSIVLSFFAVYAVVLIFHNKKKTFYPLVTLVLFNKILVILTAKSNEYRYQYPLLFCYIILMIMGYNHYVQHGLTVFKKKIKGSFLSLTVLGFSLLLTFMYNYVVK